jgi:hypothetical protein
MQADYLAISQIYGLIAAQCDEQPLTTLTNGTYPVLTNSTANKCSCNLVRGSFQLGVLSLVNFNSLGFV